MDKLKYIKLENEDGSYSSSIPLAVDSDHVDVNGNTLTNELSYKANNSSINNLQNQINSLASGSPKGVYTDAEALKAANPDTGVYIVTGNGHIYSWTKNWSGDPIDLGIYQASGIDITGELGYLYNPGSVNVNITYNPNTKVLHIPTNYGIYSRYGHNKIEDGDITLSGYGYIYYNISNRKFTTQHASNFKALSHHLLVGCYNADSNYYSLIGDYTKFVGSELGYVFSNSNDSSPNYNTLTKVLHFNSSSGIFSKKGHTTMSAQDITLSGAGYIYVNVINGVITTQHYGNFIPLTNHVCIGSYNASAGFIHLLGKYRVNNKLPELLNVYTKSETYSKGEIQSLIDNIDVYENDTKLYNSNLIDENFSLSEFVNTNNWEVTQNGLHASDNDYILLNKEYSIEQRDTEIRVILGENSIVSFMYKTNSGYALDGSLFTLDSKNNKIIIHEYFNTLGTVPNERVNQTYNFVAGREYLVNLVKEKRKNILIVTDTVTCDSVQIETNSTAVIGDLTNEFAGGRQNGHFGIWNREGNSNYIKQIIISSKIKKPLVYITGDSICEGDRCEIGSRYVDLLEEKLGVGNIAISGFSGTTISGVYNRLVSELPFLKPKYCIITIGTNGGNTISLIQQVIDYVESLGIKCIFNHISRYTNSETVNDMLDTNFADYVGCKFDVATSLDYDLSKAKDNSLFADGVHPNANGHARMYKRFKIDINL